MMFCMVKTRLLPVCISAGSKKKGNIEEGANGPRHRSCMSL